jgi:predicted small lipoprotein YifL
VQTVKGLIVLAVLCGALAGSGCKSPEELAAEQKIKLARDAEQQAAAEKSQAEYKAKIDGFKEKKCLNVRVNDTSVDFVMDDGSIVTIIAQAYKQGNGDCVPRLVIK